MSAHIPPSKPKASLSVVMTAAHNAWEKQSGKPMPDVFVLAVRGYYRDTMGKPGVNDVGQYDDAAFIVSPFGFSAWNFNSDPSRYGWNDHSGKNMARLKTGVWTYQRLKHKVNSPNGYMAFGQGEHPVTVERIRKDGTVATTETGCFGINLHRGGVNGTSSEGCLTVPEGQWIEFRKYLDNALEKTGARTFPLILIEGPIT